MTVAESTSPIADAAVAYAHAGLPIIRLRVGQKLPVDGDWTNRLVSVPSPETAALWWSQANWNVGLLTGQPSGMWVLDVDAAAGGLVSLQRLISDHGGVLRSGFVVRTGGGGLHLYFSMPPGHDITNSNKRLKKLYPGLDVRGTGGQVVLPPSVSEKGAYSVYEGRLESVDEPPAWLLGLILGERAGDPVPSESPLTGSPGPSSSLGTFRPGAGVPRYPREDANRRISAELATVAATAEGQGFNDALNGAAFELGHWVGGGHLDRADAEELLAYAVTRQFPGGPDKDDLQTISSGLSGGEATPYAVFTPAAHEVLAAGSVSAMATGFTKFGAGAISNRKVSPPPTVYDPGCGPLFYETGIHWIFGESGSGKTWVALDAIARTLMAGGTALMLDYEDDENQILDRLAALGVDDNSIQGFAYVDGNSMENSELVSNLALKEQFTLSVLDGVTSSLNAFGASDNNGGEVTAWADAIPRNMTGTVLVIDHVTKSTDTRAGYAIGSQAKRSVVTGASYEVECDVPMTKGKTGRLRLILRKDKRGGVPVRVGEVAARLEFVSGQDGHMRTSAINKGQEAQAPAGDGLDSAVVLTATVLQQAHERGDLDLGAGMRKLKDWIRGHGHLVGDSGTKRNDAMEEAIRYARGWAGLPGVSNSYRLKPLSIVDVPKRPQASPSVPRSFGDTPTSEKDEMSDMPVPSVPSGVPNP